jgi:hypothetical protein
MSQNTQRYASRELLFLTIYGFEKYDSKGNTK